MSSEKKDYPQEIHTNSSPFNKKTYAIEIILKLHKTICKLYRE